MAVGVSEKEKKPVKRKLFCSKSHNSSKVLVSSNEVEDAESPPPQSSNSSSVCNEREVSETPKRSTPLSERQQLALLRQLTANSDTPKQSKVHEKNEDKHSPLCSVEGRHSDSRYELCKRNERGETPLHVAAIKGDCKVVRKLLKRGVDVNVSDFAGWTALHEACNRGWLEIAQLLIRYGANVNAEGFGDDTPLHDASVNGHHEIVSLLLEHGADIKKKNSQWKTALDVARSEKVALILKEHIASYEKSGDKNPSRRTTEDTNPWQSGTSPCQSNADLCKLTMRKNSPQNQTHKGVDKPTSPRLTLRFQSIKPRDDKCSNTVKVVDINANEPKYQSYCVTMEAKGDVYEFQKDDGNAPSSNSVNAHQNDESAPKLNPAVSKEGDSPPKDSKNGTESVEHVDRSSPVEKMDTSEPPPSAKVNGGRSSSDSIVKDRDQGSDTEKEDSRRKRRKSSDSNQSRHSTQSHSSSSRGHKSPVSKSQHQDSHNEQRSSPKGKKRVSLSSSDTESNQSDTEMPDIVIADSLSANHNGSFAAGLHSPKVPPLKIVIPPGSNSLEGETRERSKISSCSKTALPYVVNATSETGDAAENSSQSNGEGLKETPTKSTEKSKDESNPPEERFQRVTRSSQRMQAALSSVNVSQSSDTPQTSTSPTISSSGGGNSGQKAEHSGESSTEEQSTPQTDVHPRKRKLRTRDSSADCNSGSIPSTQPPSSSSSGNEDSQQQQSQQQQPQTMQQQQQVQQQHQQPPPPPQQQQLLNSYQMYLDIRKQVDKRRKSMFVVHPKPPQGFKDYLLNRCSYVLEGNAASRLSVPMIPPPQSLEGSIKELFVQQEKERYRLRLQHLIEREKLVLSAEQEILRVHGRAARAMANQTVPLSACSILKDEEIYNVLNVDQDDKDKNVRSRYNGRLFLSWLQDVDDKWEKIKKAMLLRHHNEAESLHAVQKLDWEWKMKELAMCDMKSTPVIDDISVPMVHVSDDFDLLPA